MLTSGLALGAMLDFVMQRGRFYVTGFLHDIFTQRSWRGFVVLLIVISIHAIGLATLISAGMITPEYKELAPLTVIVGGTVSGLGIVLAGGYASGTWYHSDKGPIGSWIALVFYTLSAVAMKTGFLDDLQDALKDHTAGLTSIHAPLGVNIWPLAITLSTLTAYLAVRYLCEELSGSRPVTLTLRKAGLAHILTEKAWYVYATAAIVGILDVVVWPLSTATGRNDGLGIVTPPSNPANYVVTGDTGRFDWGVLLVLGTLVGSFIVAKASGEFRLRVPDATQGVCSVVGGICMGVDAAWAGGCAVGNGMVQVSLFSYQSWFAPAFIAVGVTIVAKPWLKPSAPSLNDIPSTPSTTNDTATDDATVSTMAPVTPAATLPVSLSSSEGAGAAGTGASPLAGVSTVAPVASLNQNVVKQEDDRLKPLGDGRYELDVIGAVCPFPPVEAKDTIGKIEIGEELVVPFNCTQTTDATPCWAVKDNHEITNFGQTDEVSWTISVRHGR